MHRSAKSSVYKKLIILIAIFLVGFASLFTLNQVFTNLIHELDKKTINLKNKITIGEFIAYDLVEIRSLFHELATTTTNRRSRELISDKIDDKIDDVNDALDVLENGGVLTRFIELNIAGHLNTIKKVAYYPPKDKDRLSLEVIDIRPKLGDIEQMVEDVNKLLEERTHYKKIKDTQMFLKSAKKVRRYYKALPSFFKRISENIRRLLYESEIELKKIQKQTIKDKAKYLKIKIALIIFVIIIILILGYIIIKGVNKDSQKLYLLNEELNENLAKQQRQEKSIRAILDSQPNIIVVSDGVYMIDANAKLFEFFDEFSTLEAFQDKHSCICDFFSKNIPNDEYIVKKDYDGLNWAEYVLAHPEKDFKVIIKKGSKKYHFALRVTKTIIDDITKEAVVVTTLNDITSEVNAQLKLQSLNKNLEVIIDNKTKELQELNENLEQKIIIESAKVREKDKQMISQSRFAAMGEMIGNIAHQWRQPLSAINTTASGMVLQMELGITDDNEIKESYSKIMGYVDFLTQTIEDFRGFFKEDKEKVDFNVIDVIEKTLSVTSATYKDNDINLIKDFKVDKLMANGMPSELSQVFLNVLNNAKDATISNNKDNKRVHIEATIEDDNCVVYIQDNAGGIPEDVIEKIFDPYFTTKHQSQGTGLGLYMTHQIITDTLKGTITASNEVFTYENKKYHGAIFTIILPLK